MSTLKITITDELSAKLKEVARHSGKSLNELVVSLLEKYFLQKPTLHAAIEAMRNGEKPGKKINIAALLQNTDPHFETVEEAIRHSRKYP